MTQEAAVRPGAPREWLLGLLLACAVLCAGTLLAQLVGTHGGERAAQEAMLQTQTTRRQLETGQLVKLMMKYTFAFADAAIRFENVPKYDTRVVSAVSAALPAGADVASMELDGRDVLLVCTTADERDARLLCANLMLDERFERVRPGVIRTTETGCIFEVTCTIHMEEGQLALAGGGMADANGFGTGRFF